MSQVDIRINTDNAAFEDNPNELQDILNKIADNGTADNGGLIFDSNGNKVGEVTHYPDSSHIIQ